MATKTTDTKEKAASSKAIAKIDVEALADSYLTHRIHQAIAEFGEPAKVADIARTIDDEAISIGLIRQALLRTPHRFVPIDRRWDIAPRYLDKQRPIKKLLQEIVTNYDAPIRAREAAREYAALAGRTTEGVFAMIERMLSGDGFATLPTAAATTYVPASWILDTSDEYTNDAAVLFYNFLPVNGASPYKSVSTDWENDPVGSVEAILRKISEKAPRVVENRLVQFLAWKALGEDFDGRALYAALLGSDRLVVLPGHRWADQDTIQYLRGVYIERAEKLADMPEEEIEVEETTPLQITEDELVELEQSLESAGERALRATTLLQDLYEVGPGDRSFASDLQTILEALRANPDRFEWVGYDRFRIPGSLPPYIGQVPESLRFPAVAQTQRHDDDMYDDQLLDSEGYERGLEREVLSAIAQDVNDQEPSDRTVWAEGVGPDSQSIDLVLKAHHKEIGTFPMCQIPPGFLATEPSIVEITLRDKGGNAYQVFADSNTQLLYGLGLFDLYADIPADSGAIVRIEKTSIPGEFLFDASGETHSEIYVSPERFEQLQNYRAEVEAGPTISTHELVRYILEHSNSAMSFLSLLTELNIVRRVPRRQLASILSAWSGFTHRGGAWSYDSKKAAQGFNKSKRKYAL